MTRLDFEVLLLIIAANAAPILANYLVGRFLNHPIDGGLVLSDGRPLFGASKTWRGFAVAILLALMVGAVLGLPLFFSACVGLTAMLGDLVSSYIKRRAGLAPSSMAAFLDQVPESVLPVLLAVFWLGLSWASAAWIVLLFIIIEWVISPLAYRLQIRKRPY